MKVHYVGAGPYRGWCGVEGKPVRIAPGQTVDLAEHTALELLASLPQWFEPVAEVMLEPPPPPPFGEDQEPAPTPIPQRRKPGRPRKTKG